MLLFLALAQAAAVAPAPAAAPATQGVISYPPAFFAAFQPANVSEMVLRLPGFLLETGAEVRGYEGSAGNVLIDGERPATKSEDLEQVLRRIPASRVERIDLIRGGAPGIDMQGKTVLANIILKPGGGFRGVMAVANNHTWDGRNGGSVRLEASGDSNGRRWELGGVSSKFIDDGTADGHGVRVDANGNLSPTDIKAEGDGLNGQLTGAFETPLAGGKLRVNGRLFQEKYKTEELDRIFDPVLSLEDSVETVTTNTSEIGATYNRKFGSKMGLEIVGLRQDKDQGDDFLFVSGDSSFFRLRRDSSETIGRSVLKYRHSEHLSFEGGAEIAVNKLDSRTGLFENDEVVEIPAANVQVKETRGEGFVKATWRPISEWTVDGSLRYESSEISSDGDVILSKTLSFLKPRLAATWAPNSDTQVRVRIEREVGQLNFDDFVATANLNTTGVTAGNPDLDPQQDWVGELAVEQRFWKSGSVTVAYRHYEITDVVDRGPVFSPDGVFDRPANIGDGTKDELAVTLSLPLDKLGLPRATLRGDATKRWSKVTDPTTRESREISGLHPLDWNATFTQDLPAWRVTYGVDAYGGWRKTYYRFNQVDTTKLKTFLRPFVEWRPQPGLSVRVELPNATARGLKRTIETYTGPRGFPGSVPTLDDRDYSTGQMFYVRVRKTIGG